jgi:regulator of protease activity HflC (stomatin/prohibitin superfamily)
VPETITTTTVVIEEEPPTFRRRVEKALNRFWDRHSTTVYIFGLLALFLIIYISPSIFHFVHSGDAGVVWRRFGAGTQVDRVYLEGFHVTPPWDEFITYNVRVQQIPHQFTAISSNGLELAVNVSIRYRPRVELLGVLHKEVGPDYLDKIVLPEVQALIRNIFGQYSPEEIYTTKRYLIQNSVDAALGEIGERYIELDDLLIKSITLPRPLEIAIQAKMIEEQRALEMRYRISREEQEARRKIIEGIGVNEFNKLISQSVSSGVLQYKSIEAALELSKSSNSKVVVLGGGEKPPIILNTGLTFDGTNDPLAGQLSAPRMSIDQSAGTNNPFSTLEEHLRATNKLFEAISRGLR